MIKIMKTLSTRVSGQNFDIFPTLVAIFSLLSFWKLWLIRDVIWDDNAWLLSAYATSNLTEFLDTGWNQFRRPILGTLVYYLFWLHKTSEIFYPVWHSLTLVAEIASPILLFCIVRTLFPRQNALAFFTATAFVLIHLDHSLPYATAVYYRIGQMVALGSLYLTILSLRLTPGIRWWPYSAALVFALVAHSVLIEPAIALEPGRALIIGWLFYVSGIRGTALARRVLIYWAPFIIAILPLAISKILFKPYGIYAGTYPTNPFFFLEWHKNFDELWHLLVRDWLSLLKIGRYTDLLGIAAWLLTLSLLVIAMQKLNRHHFASAGEANGAAPEARLYHACVLGLALLLPSVWLFEYAGLNTVLFGNQDNVHAVFMQAGYALLLGTGLTWFHQKFLLDMGWWRMVFLALPLSLGALINNASLDLFRVSWHQQSAFWHAFLQRFPSLPERADFLFDIRGQGALSDLRNHYDHEVWLNLLYSQAVDPIDFKRYRVVTLEDFINYTKKDSAWQRGGGRIERVTQLGPESINPKQLIVVLYVNNQIFVDHEILDRFGNQVPYWPWLQNQTLSPTIPPGKGARPWRLRLQELGT